jgi:hypothetical protein
MGMAVEKGNSILELFRSLEEMIKNALKKAAVRRAALFAVVQRRNRDILMEMEDARTQEMIAAEELKGRPGMGTGSRPIQQGTPSSRRKSALKRIHAEKEKQDHRSKVRVQHARAAAAVGRAKTIKERIKINREKSRDLWCDRGA